MVKNKFKSIRTLQLILTFLILNSTFYITHATVRYVSHQGSNTPPYTSWATAADSIMFAINISVFGDTIYVANGVYEEQVVMTPGLSLIGAGMDSCVIDTRNIIQPGAWTMIMADSCVLKGFHILVSYAKIASGIYSGYGNAIIEWNKISNTSWCIYISNSNTLIQNNIINYVDIGIELFNSNSIVKNNQIVSVERGILLDAVSGEYKPIIEQNLINTELFGVEVFFSSSPTIHSNIIFLNGDGATGYQGGGSDTAWIYNNLVVSPGDFEIRRGFVNTIVPTFEYNNFLIGDFSSYGIYAVDFNIIQNNVIMNSPLGITIEPGHNPTILYNNSWNNSINYGGFTPDSTNHSVDPMIVNEDTALGELDFHLQMFSPLIDAGDPNILDVDGSRSDIGLYGGPFGESYVYQDLAPKPPRNLSAVVDSEYITLTWNRNTEADFKNYNLFRDTTANFTADSTTFITTLIDTFYIQIIPAGIDALYYKLTATDNQGNKSQPSEELAVIITSIKEYPSSVSDYRLYQNYPNPFNPSTKIAYKLKERGYVKLYVYDIKGELVSVLVNQIQDAGYYEVDFSGDGQGTTDETLSQKLASGIYIYQIMVKSENNIPVFSDMKKMILLK